MSVWQPLPLILLSLLRVISETKYSPSDYLIFSCERYHFNATLCHHHQQSYQHQPQLQLLSRRFWLPDHLPLVQRHSSQLHPLHIKCLPGHVRERALGITFLLQKNISFIIKLIFIHQASSVLTANWSTLSMQTSGEKKEMKSALIQLSLWVDTLHSIQYYCTCPV